MSTSPTTLARTNKLYGREKELRQLKDAYRLAKDGDKPEAERILVTGVSGSGKSSLVLRAFERVDCVIGKGKFEQRQQHKPFDTLSQCLSEMCSDIIQNKNVDTYKKLLLKSFGEGEILLLSDLIPDILIITGVASRAKRSHGGASKEGLEQLKFSLRLFIETLSIESVVVMILDDLQWIDTESLNFLKSILNNSALKHFVFVGSYRNDEVDGDHVLSKFVNSLDPQPTKLHLDNLTTKQMNEMLCDMLKVEDATDLTELLHSRTHGNAFHLLQLLDYLQAEQMLQFSTFSFRWTWDVTQIRNKTQLSENAVEIVTAKLKRYSQPELECLKICSCLGFRFDRSTASIVGPSFCEGDIEILIQSLVEHGSLEDVTGQLTKFVHDKVFQAAEALIEASERASIHLQIGKLLLQTYSPDDAPKEELDSSLLFLCVDQLNLGREAIEDDGFRTELARLNLLAGQRAASFSSFVPSARYMALGISLLTRPSSSCWDTEYKLTLELYSTLAEVTFYSGLADKTKAAVQQIVEHALKKDRTRAYVVHLHRLIGESKTKEAKATALIILDIVGEPVTPQSSKAVTQYADRVKRRLKTVSDDEIKSLPLISSPQKMLAIQVMCELFVPLDRKSKAGEDKDLAHLLLWKSIEMTLDHGLAPYSAVSFSLLAILCTDDIELGYRCSSLANSMLDPNNPDMRAIHARLIFNGMFMRYWREPLSLLVDSAIKCHRVGLRSGDHFSGFHGVLLYTMFYFYAGLPLGPLIKDLEKFTKTIMDYGYNVTVLWMLPCYQAALNLAEGPDNMLDLASQKVTQSLRKKCGWKPGGGGEDSEMSFNMQIAFYCEEFEHATAIATKLQNDQNELFSVAFTFQPRVFFFCLLAIRNARNEKRSKKHKMEAQKYFEIVKEWVVRRKSINMAHKFQIIEAEMMSLEATPSSGQKNAFTKALSKRLPLSRKGTKQEEEGLDRFEKLRAAYDKSIASSKRAGFLQDAALAAHLASFAIPPSQDIYFDQALELYCAWGADGVVAYVSRKRNICSDGISSNNDTSLGYRGRSRYDNEVYNGDRSLEFAVDDSSKSLHRGTSM